MVVGAIGVSAQTPTCAGRAATIVGTGGDDVLRGTSGADVIVALGGRDKIFGGGGRDLICAGPGADKISGGSGADRIFGEGGNDVVRGGFGIDQIIGGPGNDRLFGGVGNDVLTGSVGNDFLFGETGNDTCNNETRDRASSSCEFSNGLNYSGSGDAVVDVNIPDAFVVAEHCFPFVGRCDKFTVARVELNGTRSFDALSVQAFAADGSPIASYGTAGDVLTGVFLFSDVPAVLEIDSGGGAWSATFFGASALPSTPNNTMRSVGNDVYVVRNPLGGLVEAEATWDGFGNFALIGVSPSEGRDLILNEVRFSGRDQPPFATEAVAKSGISLVQVIADEGAWTIEFSN